jgi:serine phosphatase RsbU (regulator of sigma subunit)
VKASLKVLDRSARQSPRNYAHLARIVRAELADLRGAPGAGALYEEALELCRKNGAPVQDQALCLELKGASHERRGDAGAAAAMRDQAAQEYLVWGATVLHERLAGPLSVGVRVPASEASLSLRSSSSSSSHNHASLDLMGVMRASQAISGALVLEELMGKLLRTMMQNAGADRGILALQGDRPLVVESVAPEGERVSSGGLEGRTDVALSALRYAERTLEPVVLNDTTRPSPFSGDPRLSDARAMSLLCMPIVRQKRLVGALYLENTLATDAFTRARCEFLEMLGVQAAISLENAMLYDTLDSRVKERTRQLRESLEQLEATQAALQTELSDAATFVRSLLPEPIRQGPLRTDWRYVPSAHLGGDGLGYFPLEDGRLAFFVLDVAGHGFAASLLCSSILTALHARRVPGANFADPVSVLAALNSAFPLSTGGRHFTLWYGVLDPTSGDLRCANGGHPCAVICGPTGCREVGAPGVMLGVIPDADFPEERTVLQRGERLFVFSDGAYEIEAPDGQILPYERFEAELARAATDPDGVGRMLAFAAGAKADQELDDDFTMLSVDRI